jgi:hypothetical protein
MSSNQQKVLSPGMWILAAVLLNVVVVRSGYISNPEWYKVLALTLPLLALALLNGASERKNLKKKTHSSRINS